jgi:hypothetical protein
VYDGIDLVAVTVYRKGAQEVAARLEAQEHTIAALRRQLAARSATPGPSPPPATEPVTDLVAGPPSPVLLTAGASAPYRSTLSRRRPASAPRHP